MSAAAAKFSSLSKLKYRDQAVWFLNGFWGDGVDGEVSNKVWDYTKKFVALDLLGPTHKGEEGNELDQFWSAKFLEDMDTALPAIQRKEALRSIDQDSNGKMSLIEYLVWKYKKGVKETAEAPQGDNTAAIKRAQEAVHQVATQMAECEEKIEAQKRAKEENDRAKSANDKAKEANDSAISANDKAVAELKQAERALQLAERELADAIADLKRQEDEFKNKCDSLDAKSKDQSSPLVQRSKAANELAQLKGEDPLPLRKAKITQEAALRKVQKQKKAAEEARLVTEHKGRELEEASRKLEDARRKLEQAARELERAIRELEQAYASLETKMAEAQQELEEIKNKPGGGKGALWWLQRELFEVDYRLPRAKQRFDHSQPFNYNP